MSTAEQHLFNGRKRFSEKEQQEMAANLRRIFSGTGCRSRKRSFIPRRRLHSHCVAALVFRVARMAFDPVVMERMSLAKIQQMRP